MGLLNKYVVFAIYAFLFIAVVNSCNGCKTNKETTRIRKDLDSLTVDFGRFKDHVRSEIYTKDQLDIKMEIEGYEISKRMLFDNNTVVRTTRRPDDILIEYDNKIKELRKKIHE